MQQLPAECNTALLPPLYIVKYMEVQLEVKRSWELQRLVPWSIYPRYENVFHIYSRAKPHAGTSEIRAP